MLSFSEQLTLYINQINNALPVFWAETLGESDQRIVAEAMQYSLLGGGKRIRAVLAMAFCELCKGSLADVLPFAAAIEMVHAYSLIHDDLPCMDDDDLRRGKPSCHIQFGEANALLAGDGLLNLAFETMLSQTTVAQVGAEKAVAAARTLGQAAGIQGMIGGQTIDLLSEGKEITKEELDHLHLLKTGALIRASAQIGCIIAGTTAEIMAKADRYAKNLGLAFQIVDDVLDVVADENILGKPVGSDKKQHKTTYVTLFGVEKSKEKVRALILEADLAIKGSMLDQRFLYQLADMLAERVF